jgi:hypothetical protein
MKKTFLAVSCLSLVCAACGSDKATGVAQFEALPVTAATVQAAVELMTAVPIPVLAQCTGDPTINCVGGTAGAALSIPLTHTTPVVVQTSPGHYTFGTDLTINSAPAIPFTYTGVSCNITINTTAGTSPTVHLGGTATFASQTNNGVLNRLDIAPTLTGAEDADITVGGGTLCNFGTFFNTMLIDSFVTQFEQLGGQLCGAPGPTLFESCPETTFTTYSRRKR